MLRVISLSSMALGIYLASLVAASGNAECFEQPSVQATGERYEMLKQGAVVRDNWTGLIWSRCLLGEVWNADAVRCEGTALQLAWADALAAAATAGWADEMGWRAGNVKELESIVERACASPALNEGSFNGYTDSVNSPQWSSTQVESYALGAWTINFKNGSVIPSEKSTLLPIRVVKTVE